MDLLKSIILLFVCLLACHDSIKYDEELVPTPTAVGDLDSTAGVEVLFTAESDLIDDHPGLKLWDWTTMNLPPMPWEDETVLAYHFNVDSAYDPDAVQLTSTGLRFFINPINPATGIPEQYNYRAEVHTQPWPIKHPLGTEQWMGWEYTFGEDYEINIHTPITIFQNHPGVNGLSPQIELEIAALNDPNPAQGGEIQIINVPNGDRIVTDVKPKAREKLSVVVHVVYGLEDQGQLQVWLNGELYYDKAVSTVYSQHPWGGNNKWGVYHHMFNGTDSPEYVNLTLSDHAENVELFMGPLKTWTRSPSHPEYRKDAYSLIRPEN